MLGEKATAHLPERCERQGTSALPAQRDCWHPCCHGWHQRWGWAQAGRGCAGRRLALGRLGRLPTGAQRKSRHHATAAPTLHLVPPRAARWSTIAAQPAATQRRTWWCQPQEQQQRLRLCGWAGCAVGGAAGLAPATEAPSLEQHAWLGRRVPIFHRPHPLTSGVCPHRDLGPGDGLAPHRHQPHLQHCPRSPIVGWRLGVWFGCCPLRGGDCREAPDLVLHHPLQRGHGSQARPPPLAPWGDAPASSPRLNHH